MHTIWNLSDLGSYIHSLSQKAGFPSKEKFADYCGLSRSHYSKITNGRIAVPVKMMHRIFQKLGISASIETRQYIRFTTENQGEILIDPLPVKGTAEQALRTYREQNGVTQAEVAKLLNITQGEISDIERGRSRTPLSEKILEFLRGPAQKEIATYDELDLLETAHPLLLMSESILRLIEKHPKNFALIKNSVNKGHDRILIAPHEQWTRYGMALKRRVEREITDKNIRARLRIYTAPDILFHLKLACAMYPGYQVLGLSQGGSTLTLSEDDNRALMKFFQGQLNELDAHWRRNERVSIQGFLRYF